MASRGRSLLSQALLAAVLALVACAALAECPKPAHYRVATWQRVVDGDTLKLADGERVRLIGVNTPELAHHGRPAEPVALQARRAVQSFLAESRTIWLVVGRASHDHYGRLLAHVYRPGDGASLEEMLLRAGLGFAIAIGPDVNQAACLAAAERPARAADRGVWAQPVFFPANRDTALRPGFALVEVTVVRVVPGKHQWWLDTAGDLALRIGRADLDYFDRNRLKALVGERVRVRGWLIARRHSAAVRRGYAPWLMSLGHPADLERLGAH